MHFSIVKLFLGVFNTGLCTHTRKSVYYALVTTVPFWPLAFLVFLNRRISRQGCVRAFWGSVLEHQQVVIPSSIPLSSVHSPLPSLLLERGFKNNFVIVFWSSTMVFLLASYPADHPTNM
jgi:hypothetical protein